MSEAIALLDILEARRRMRDSQRNPHYILSSLEALRWCNLTDHKLEVCCHCRGDHDTCHRLLKEAEPAANPQEEREQP